VSSCARAEISPQDKACSTITSLLNWLRCATRAQTFRFPEESQVSGGVFASDTDFSGGDSCTDPCAAQTTSSGFQGQRSFLSGLSAGQRAHHHRQCCFDLPGRGLDLVWRFGLRGNIFFRFLRLPAFSQSRSAFRFFFNHGCWLESGKTTPALNSQPSTLLRFRTEGSL